MCKEQTSAGPKYKFIDLIFLTTFKEKTFSSRVNKKKVYAIPKVGLQESFVFILW